MTYRFAIEDKDYSDFSGGRVIYSLPGFPAFPVRLASEIFQRAWNILRPNHRLTLYDPTCGGAYHLAALGFLHGNAIETILASDVDTDAVGLAQRNLGLLSLAGLEQRTAELRRLLETYGKPSHMEALQSAGQLRQQLAAVLASHSLRTHVFQANALDSTQMRTHLSGEQIDLIFSDVPYGHLTGWQLLPAAGSGEQSALWRMLDALRPLLSASTLVAIAADKNQKAAHDAYRRVERFQIGKRQVSFLQLV